MEKKVNGQAKQFNVSREYFFSLLYKETQTLSQEEAQRKKSKTTDDYIAKQARQRKAEDASDSTIHALNFEVGYTLVAVATF